MRIARARCSIRLMMLVVALAGVLAGVKELSRRRLYYLERAKAVARAENGYASEAARIEEQVRSGSSIIVSGCEGVNDPDWLIREYRKRADVCNAAKRRFEYAARYPWLAVEPVPQRLK